MINERRDFDFILIALLFVSVFCENESLSAGSAFGDFDLQLSLGIFGMDLFGAILNRKEVGFKLSLPTISPLKLSIVIWAQVAGSLELLHQGK